MGSKRTSDFSLKSAIRSSSFTPSVRDVAELVDLIESEDDALKAIQRVGAPAIGVLLEQIDQGKAVGKIFPLAAKLSRTPNVAADVMEALLRRAVDRLVSKTPADRIVAARAAAYLPTGSIAAHLADALGVETDPAAIRALLRAASSHDDSRLREVAAQIQSSDPETLRLHARLSTIQFRDQQRKERGALTPERALNARCKIALKTRDGLLPVLLSNLARQFPDLPTKRAGNSVEVEFHGKLDDFLTSRLWTEVAIDLGAQSIESDDVAAAAVRLLSQPIVRDVITTWTSGTPTFRLSWTDGGKRRKTIWEIAANLQSALPWLVNDPRESLWRLELTINESKNRATLAGALVPVGFGNARFPYRQRTVRAASHPVIAAALVQLANLTSDDRVWDPFCGSGVELCECQLAAPIAQVVGTDLDPAAIEAARENYNALATETQAPLALTVADATTFRPAGITAIVTNPPLGWRVSPNASVLPLYRAFLTNAAAVLAPEGRIVWISALPDETRAFAEELGFKTTHESPIEMGCLGTRIQRFVRT